MKNHCGGSVGFSFIAALWFRRKICLREVSEINVVIRSSSYFQRQVQKFRQLFFLVSLFSFFFVKDQIASFQSKQIVVFFN